MSVKGFVGNPRDLSNPRDHVSLWFRMNVGISCKLELGPVQFHANSNQADSYEESALACKCSTRSMGESTCRGSAAVFPGYVP